MSIQNEINRIKQSKSNIISALETKGVTVPADASIDDLSALVEAIQTGSEPVLQSKTASPSTSKQTIKPDTGYDGLSQVTINAMTTATQATPSISVSSSGLITASTTQNAGYVSAGTKSATKQLTTKSATTYTPTTTDQTIANGTYLTGVQTIKGDSNLVANNIAQGVSIFGVTGTLASGGGDSTLETVKLYITNMNGNLNNIYYTNSNNELIKQSINSASVVVNVAKGKIIIIEGDFSSSSAFFPSNIYDLAIETSTSATFIINSNISEKILYIEFDAERPDEPDEPEIDI